MTKIWRRAFTNDLAIMSSLFNCISLLFFFYHTTWQWVISSNGRAPPLHAGSTGIDTRILQDKNFFTPGNILFGHSFSFCSYFFIICLLMQLR